MTARYVVVTGGGAELSSGGEFRSACHSPHRVAEDDAGPRGAGALARRRNSGVARMIIAALAPVRIRSLSSVMLVIALGSASGAAPADRGRAAFIEAHRCAVVERLRSIHLRGPRSTSRDRFIAVRITAAEQSYVQCIFFDEDTKMHCEAASGAYGPRTEALRLERSPSSIPALHRLGFTQGDPNGNYAREIALGTPPALDVAADLMLGALHDAYGARLDTRLEFTAPRAALPRHACPGPVS
ncbi:TY-Chap domain-containing protein [Methylobacterium sp. J-068]|uniref:TY-Chap domain-containing protein n=1 Tax=Methylobacterium sp. J-068 TaxID=2836649 RepID=UPI001FB9FBC0|nr:hypothetical protein [Methylobacterium sp. J-068]